MGKTVLNREQTMDLVRRHIKTDNLMNHILAVEAVMRYFARQFGEDEELWGCIGLAHDIDYEEHPEEHLQHTRPILEEAGWPEEYIRAVLSHGWGIVTDVKPETKLEKTLYTIDELTGLVAATALVRPSKSVLDMKAKSVKKKWKSRAFSAGVDREVIQQGADMLGMELSEVITWTIMGMREVADQIGLKGDIPAASAE